MLLPKPKLKTVATIAIQWLQKQVGSLKTGKYAKYGKTPLSGQSDHTTGFLIYGYKKSSGVVIFFVYSLLFMVAPPYV